MDITTLFTYIYLGGFLLHFYAIDKLLPNHHSPSNRNQNIILAAALWPVAWAQLAVNIIKLLLFGKAN